MGDTSRNENWNADDADAADNTDRLRFYPRPPRRLRRPRPIFRAEVSAVGGEDIFAVAEAAEETGRASMFSASRAI